LYESGARLGGVEDLLVYVERAAAAYEADARLARIAFLLRRAGADFETALDATLGGYIGVAADAMRDVLEIEALLWDFTAHPHNIERWLDGADAERRKHFAPVTVRERLKRAGVDEFTRATSGADYAAHSAALHVSPHVPVIGQKGRVDDPFIVDAGFWELLEHGARFTTAADMCRAVNVPDPAAASATIAHLERLQAARERAREMQTFFLATLEAPPKLRASLGREPTIDEIRAYVARTLEEPA
jgi:hypothetical protein